MCLYVCLTFFWLCKVRLMSSNAPSCVISLLDTVLIELTSSLEAAKICLFSIIVSIFSGVVLRSSLHKEKQSTRLIEQHKNEAYMVSNIFSISLYCWDLYHRFNKSFLFCNNSSLHLLRLLFICTTLLVESRLCINFPVMKQLSPSLFFTIDILQYASKRSNRAIKSLVIIYYIVIIVFFICSYYLITINNSL